MVTTLAPRARALYAVPPRSPRALAPERYLHLAAPHTKAQAFASVAEGLAAAQAAARADGGQVVVAGSLYLVGEARGLLSSG
jgi:folylpolyglutamate synthase/dihydropteroate synthase